MNIVAVGSLPEQSVGLVKNGICWLLVASRNAGTPYNVATTEVSFTCGISGFRACNTYP